MHRYKPSRSGLHACKYTYTKVQSANIDGRTPAQYSVRRVDEHEAITRFTRGNTLLTFTGERNPPNAPPRLIPARLVPIRKFYGKYDTWGGMLDEHLALRQARYQRTFQRQYPGRIRFSSALQRGHRKRIIKEPLYFGARLSAESWNYGNTCCGIA